MSTTGTSTGSHHVSWGWYLRLPCGLDPPPSPTTKGGNTSSGPPLKMRFTNNHRDPRFKDSNHPIVTKKGESAKMREANQVIMRDKQGKGPLSRPDGQERCHSSFGNGGPKRHIIPDRWASATRGHPTSLDDDDRTTLVGPIPDCRSQPSAVGLTNPPTRALTSSTPSSSRPTKNKEGAPQPTSTSTSSTPGPGASEGQAPPPGGLHAVRPDNTSSAANHQQEAAPG
eukprot:jgi/Psemu1/38076/gm1.38076_g